MAIQCFDQARIPGVEISKHKRLYIYVGSETVRIRQIESHHPKLVGTSQCQIRCFTFDSLVALPQPLPMASAAVVNFPSAARLFLNRPLAFRVELRI
jgi:hypothetical protein